MTATVAAAAATAPARASSSSHRPGAGHSASPPAGVSRMIAELLVKPGDHPHFSNRDPGDRLGLDKQEGHKRIEKLQGRIDLLQQRLYGEGTRSLLLVLQGLDGAGKDGVIRSVFTRREPAGLSRSPVPRAVGIRARARLPLAGARRDAGARPDRRLQPLALRGRRHRRRARLVARRTSAQPAAADPRLGAHARRRGHGDREGLPPRLAGGAGRALQGAARGPGEALEVPRRRPRRAQALRRLHGGATKRRSRETSTEWAPWYVVPADHNWVKALAVATLLVDELERIDPQLPEPDPGIDPKSI